VKNFGIKLQNVEAEDGSRLIVTMGNSFIVMREQSNEDIAIELENIEGITITQCKAARVSRLRFWLIRKLAGM